MTTPPEAWTRPWWRRIGGRFVRAGFVCVGASCVHFGLGEPAALIGAVLVCATWGFFELGGAVVRWIDGDPL